MMDRLYGALDVLGDRALLVAAAAMFVAVAAGEGRHALTAAAVRDAA
ncbi:hypothetical protein [Frankia sp. R82]|nr:hypothetical protein [Frankia sp. R82]MCM3884165.1 hypothetical protein [Frankia sp. R82]